MPAHLDPRRWVLLVTEGLTVAYPPEIYRERTMAEREAERWAWLFSIASELPIERPFEGRWQVGEHWIRLVDAHMYEEKSDEIWVGTYWTRDGLPDPEAELFASREEAREWAVTPSAGRVLRELHELPWSVSAAFQIRDEQEEASVHLAKVVVG